MYHEVSSHFHIEFDWYYESDFSEQAIDFRIREF